MTTECDNCGAEIAGRRVHFSTEATDESGVDVVLTKHWVVCPACADSVFDSIDEPSPWSDEDFKTVVMPEEEDVASHAWGLPPGMDLG